ncbi:hypothetical protein JHW43_001447 [Diplocarpon mali]|nr:hypothetical protein JHW43_001447 [Diplocarpon mali]
MSLDGVQTLHVNRVLEIASNTRSIDRPAEQDDVLPLRVPVRATQVGVLFKRPLLVGILGFPRSGEWIRAFSSSPPFALSRRPRLRVHGVLRTACSVLSALYVDLCRSSACTSQPLPPSPGSTSARRISQWPKELELIEHTQSYPHIPKPTPAPRAASKRAPEIQPSPVSLACLPRQAIRAGWAISINNSAKQEQSSLFLPPRHLTPAESHGKIGVD